MQPIKDNERGIILEPSFALIILLVEQNKSSSLERWGFLSPPLSASCRVSKSRDFFFQDFEWCFGNLNSTKNAIQKYIRLHG